MKYTLLPIFLSALFFLISCGNKEINPAADGFDQAGSDPEAIAIADKVMEAMGGRAAWDATRYLTWNFFGSRLHHWDKETGDIRIESAKDNYTLLMNIHSMQGKLFKDSLEVNHPDSLANYLEKGKSAWINDAYWLVMPFKLKDSGVTLKYKGEGNTEDGAAADILELTFDNIGDTPENKYDVYVDKQSNLVTQWAFYPNAEDTEPRFITPWQGYKPYGKIKLSGDRGKYQLTDIDAPTAIDTAIFTEF